MQKRKKVLSLSAIALAISLTTGCSQLSQTGPTVSQQQNPEIIKSPADNRQYAHMQLENGMQVILVSDPQTKQSAAALAVAAGSFQEPASQQGLAHYLEHMLFLGTEKYPDSESYNKFVAQYGGSSNAYTAADHTNYVVTIDNVAFDEALDRFSDFFKAPTLDRQYSDKERNAVHSEWTMKGPSDGVIRESLGDRLLNPEHPGQRFNWGNLDSLKDKPGSDLYQQMLDYYHTYYSANLMTAVLMSDLPIEQMKVMAQKHFKDVPNRNTPKPKIKAQAFTDKQKGVLVRLVPQKDQKQLRIEFPIENNSADFQSKPNTYLTYLLNSEMPGTANALLKQSGLAEYLRTYASPSAHGNSGTFNLVVSLTDKGLQNRDQVMAILLAYLDKLKTQGIDKKYYKEIQTSLANDFRFLQKQDPMSEVWDIAANMLYFPTQHVLDNAYSFTQFDPDKIQKVLNQLDIQQARVWYIDKQQPHNQSMQYFKGLYQLDKIQPELFGKWQNLASEIQVNLPKANSLMPENFEIAKSEPQHKPQRLLNEPGLELWFAQSKEFKQQPKAFIGLNLNSEKPMLSAANQVKTAMLLDAYLFDNLATIEEANAAGMSINLFNKEGLSLNVSGFDDKQQQLLLSQLQTLKHYQISEKRFAITKEKYIRGLKNKAKSPVINQLFPNFSKLVKQHAVSDQALMAAAEQVTATQVNQFLQQLLAEANLRMFIFGNYSSEQAKAIAKAARAVLPVKTTLAKAYQSKDLVPQTNKAYSLNKDVGLTDVGLLDAYVFPQQSYAHKAAAELLVQMIRQPLFDQIRTEEQLAYAVGAFNFSLNDATGIGFYAQTPVKGPDELMQRFNAFRQSFTDKLAQYPADKFQDMKMAMLNELTAPVKNVSQEASVLSQDWNKRKYNFDSKQKFIDAVTQTQLQDVQAMYQQMLTPEQVMRILVQLRGTEFQQKDYVQNPGLTAVGELQDFHQQYH